MRIAWAPGWALVTVVIVCFAASALVLAKVNPVIYRARSRFQKGTKKWRLILMAVMSPAMLAEIPVATLDSGRLGSRRSASASSWAVSR